MASSNTQHLVLLLLLLSLVDQACVASSRKLASLVQQPPPNNLLTYHNGALLEGDIPITILWYGKFTPTEKSIVTDFLVSLTPRKPSPTTTPSTSQWWKTIEDLYLSKSGKTNRKSRILLSGLQLSDEKCSVGKSLRKSQIAELAAKADPKRSRVVLVLTAEDVAVEGFCMSSCGFHGSDERSDSAYIWVGNSATQCPGQCAWPFHQPIYGPQGPPLVAPNNDVGMDGMVINVAGLLAGTVTNPFGGGFFQGDSEAPLEAASACPGTYGKGAYPGYAGDLLVDAATGASYNAVGANGRKYLLPAIFDPSTSSCSTLV